MPLPWCAEHVWEWYLQLQHVGEHLTYTEVDSWSKMAKIIIRPEEIEILMAMFYTRREWWDQHQKKADKST